LDGCPKWEEPNSNQAAPGREKIIIITNYVTKQRAQLRVKCAHAIFIKAF